LASLGVSRYRISLATQLIIHANVSDKLMKKIINILLIVLAITNFSCEKPNKRKSNILNRSDSLKLMTDRKNQDYLDKQRQIEDQKRIDSLRFDKILSKALKIAEQNSDKDVFRNTFVEPANDSSCQVEVIISSDFFFTKQYPHLIIRRTSPGTIYIDIFSKNNKKFVKVLAHEQWDMEYTGDTIRDVNGDNLKDFIVNWYGSSGCCLKAFSNVYLLMSDKKSFFMNSEFINPTFSPEEQIIRGICYGHPGETEMYKYKWKGEKVDTLEYVYYEKNSKGEKTGMILVSNRIPYGNNFIILKRLSEVPMEYTTIKGFDWFTGKGYE
jgi:hypothetical protein